MLVMFPPSWHPFEFEVFIALGKTHNTTKMPYQKKKNGEWKKHAEKEWIAV